MSSKKESVPDVTRLAALVRKLNADRDVPRETKTAAPRISMLGSPVLEQPHSDWVKIESSTSASQREVRFVSRRTLKICTVHGKPVDRAVFTIFEDALLASATAPVDCNSTHPLDDGTSIVWQTQN